MKMRLSIKQSAKIFWVVVIVGFLGIFYCGYFKQEIVPESTSTESNIQCNNLETYAGLFSTVDVAIENNGPEKKYLIQFFCYDKNNSILKIFAKQINVNSHSLRVRKVMVPNETRTCKFKIVNKSHSI